MTRETPRRRPAEPPASLDRRTRNRIGRELRSLYADLLTAPVPERFAQLLVDIERGHPGGPRANRIDEQETS